ncbi:MAG: hypothetical protein ACOYL6_00635 [Bacteriovoracaceae bacterium]
MKSTFLLIILFLHLANVQANGQCDPEFKSYVTKYDKFQNAVTLAQERNRLLADIRAWQKFMGREVGQLQYRKAKIESFLKFSLKHDRPQLVKEHFESMSNKVQLAYHIIKKNRQLEEELGALLLKSPNHPDLSSVKQKMANIYQENLKQAKVIARHIDEYSTTFTNLEKIAKGSDKSAENAKYVLLKLQSQYILDNFFLEAQIVGKETPTVKDVFAILDEYTEADIYHLKIAKRLEIVSALFSLSPTESFFKYLDKVMLKIPWVNETKFRAFIAEIQDSKLHALYYADIERVLMSESQAEERLDLLMNLAAASDEAFLTTFSRRVDAKDLWKELKTAAAEKDPDFLKTMEEAEKAGKNLSRLTQLKDNTGAKIITRFLDLAMASAITAGTIYYFDDQGILKTKPDPKKPGVLPLSKEEEKELDDSLEVASALMEEMKKDK